MKAAPPTPGQPADQASEVDAQPAITMEQSSELLQGAIAGARAGEANSSAAHTEKLVHALRVARETLAVALKVNAPAYFVTDEDVARHTTIKTIDEVLAECPK